MNFVLTIPRVDWRISKACRLNVALSCRLTFAKALFVREQGSIFTQKH